LNFQFKGGQAALSHLRKPHATLIIHEDSLRRIRPRLFNILLDWQQVEVTISYIFNSLQFVHLTALLFSASIFLFGSEPVLKQIDHHFKRA
jgi:hypothetical protein